MGNNPNMEQLLKHFRRIWCWELTGASIPTKTNKQTDMSIS